MTALAKQTWPRVQVSFWQDRWIVALIVILAALRISLIFFSWSPSIGYDGDGYITPARAVAAGTTVEYIFGVLIYPWLVATMTTLFHSIYSIIVLQYVLSIIAPLALFFALKPYTRLGAVLAAGFVVFDPQLGYLQNFLHTDGLYGSMQILAFSALLWHMPPRARPALRWSFALGVFCAVAYLVRTVGLLGIVPVMLVYGMALRSWRHTALLVIGYGTGVLVLVAWGATYTGQFMLDYRLAYWQPERLSESVVVEVATPDAGTGAESGTEPQVTTARYLISPRRVRHFANFFVASGHYQGGFDFLQPIADEAWKFRALPTFTALGQFFSWLALIWDTVSSSLWLLVGALMVACAPRAALKWPILFGLLLFVYHAAATVMFNKVVARYVTVVSAYREVMFAFLLVFALQGFWALRTQTQGHLQDG